MSIKVIKQYVTAKLSEGFNSSRSAKSEAAVIESFVLAISLKDESSPDPLLLDSLVSESDLRSLFATGQCDDELFESVYSDILSRGFRKLGSGTGRIVFEHDDAEDLVFKLVIPDEDELEDNLLETDKEKKFAFDADKEGLFMECIPATTRNSLLDRYFIVCRKAIPLFDDVVGKGFVISCGRSIIEELGEQFPSVEVSELGEHILEKLKSYYELASVSFSGVASKNFGVGGDRDVLDEFCLRVVTFTKELKPDNVGLTRDVAGKLKFVMLDV